MQGEETDTGFINGDIKIVDHMVALYNLVGGLRVALDERGEGVPDLLFNQPAHFQHLGPKLLEFFFVLAIRMKWHNGLRFLPI